MEEQSCLPRPDCERGARAGGGGSKLDSWKNFLGPGLQSPKVRERAAASRPCLLGPPWTFPAFPDLPSSHRCSSAAANASVKSLQLISSPPY